MSPRAFNIEAGRRRAPMYLSPGLIPVSVRRGDVREEERRRRALSTPGKGGGVPGVSRSGIQGRYNLRRHQGGGEVSPLKYRS